ncbi:FAD binding domain-containing protein [Suillus clintonianus]|uniref:FAD binding domain-containing protein n=1 Tax=Suillus clintonianus TaxID=1904413 RepID=UPI001B884D0B|nr:FAD binding domain-containing protein [Suillus clintonianus]KAG2131334.1 FAD binding domain-containing protein [Suillus clintonianus]
MNHTHPPVLIVGAGPAGLVAALTLLQNGIPVRIIEQDSKPRIGQRGPGIFPRSLELFNFLGVPDVNDMGKPFPCIREYKFGVAEHTHKELDIPRTQNTPSIPFNVPKLMGQQLLDVILRRHLDKLSCSVEFGTELRSFTQSDEGVAAVLAKKQGDDEILEIFDAKWMIGADGGKSTVRKQLGVMFPGESMAGFRVVTGDICLAGPGLDRTYWHRFGDLNDKCVSLRPTDEVGEDGWHFFILGRDIDMTKLAQNEELIFETIALLIPMEITFNKIVCASEYRANVRMVDKFSDGRVFLAGDAAHVHSPTGGQGLNSSVQDAFNLSWKLALVEKGLADKTLLETYNEERLPVITEMLEVTTSILKRAMTAGGKDAWRTTLLYMLGIHCRFSSIVLDEFSTSVEGKPINIYRILDEMELEAGDRAPDAPKLLHVQPGESDLMTLFSLYRPWRHTVVVFVPSPTDATPILAALEPYDKHIVQSAVILPSSAPATPVASPADFVLLDQGDHAFSAYLVEATQTRVFVIRPDGVIGAIVHGAEGVKKYFSRIFHDI